MNSNENGSILGDFTVLDIKDTRTFQHLALLVDRSDFKDDVKNLKPLILAKLINSPQSKIENYLTSIPKEIYSILEKYQYPSDLAEGIVSLIVNNKISDKEVHNYDPAVGQPKSKLRGYLSHPFNFRLDPNIKIHRYWYLLYQQNTVGNKNIYLGYRELSKIVGKRFTTISTAIKAYQTKISIPII